MALWGAGHSPIKEEMKTENIIKCENLLSGIKNNPVENFGSVLYVDKKIKIDEELTKVVFNWLKRWELATPIFCYDDLLKDIAKEQDRERILEVVKGEGRIPIYDTRMVYFRNCENSKKVIEEYKRLVEIYIDEKMAFLESLWIVKPLVIWLPKI